jgi:hypothetical protein
MLSQLSIIVLTQYTYKGILTDLFPQLNPKTTSTASFTMTAVN